jgi:hypothetical protein
MDQGNTAHPRRRNIGDSGPKVSRNGLRTSRDR